MSLRRGLVALSMLAGLAAFSGSLALAGASAPPPATLESVVDRLADLGLREATALTSEVLPGDRLEVRIELVALARREGEVHLGAVLVGESPPGDTVLPGQPMALDRSSLVAGRVVVLQPGWLIPPALRPGRYTLRIGLFASAEGARAATEATTMEPGVRITLRAAPRPSSFPAEEVHRVLGEGHRLGQSVLVAGAQGCRIPLVPPRPAREIRLLLSLEDASWVTQGAVVGRLVVEGKAGSRILELRAGVHLADRLLREQGGRHRSADLGLPAPEGGWTYRASLGCRDLGPIQSLRLLPMPEGPAVQLWDGVLR